jgi:hypothetical protein
LTRLASFLENNITNGHQLAVVITDGYTPPTAGQTFTGVTSLTAEGRELGMIIGIRAALLNPTQTQWQENAVLTPSAATLHALSTMVLFYNDVAVRQLAEMAWSAGFNWLQNVGPLATSARIPHLQVASVARTCGGVLDLAFLLDGSGSVGLAGWQSELQFMVDVVERFSPSANGTRVAVSTFGGPRERDGSHFMNTVADAANVSTGQPCNLDAQCFDFSTTDVVERCSVNTGAVGPNGTCFRLEGEHCPIGTIYSRVTYGTTTVPSCMCPVNRTCLAGPPASTCSQGYYNQSDCYTSPAQVTCALRSFFNQSCGACDCDLTSADWRWDSGFSAWTDVNFSSDVSVGSLAATAQAGMVQ